MTAPVTPKTAGLHRTDSYDDDDHDDDNDDDDDDDDSIFKVGAAEDMEIDDRKPAAQKTKNKPSKTKMRHHVPRTRRTQV